MFAKFYQSNTGNSAKIIQCKKLFVLGIAFCLSTGVAFAQGFNPVANIQGTQSKLYASGPPVCPDTGRRPLGAWSI